MNFVKNSNKRMRLDFEKNFDNNFNDDLWGQDDITAEEFDMLEVQATQATQEDSNTTVQAVQNNLVNSFRQPLPVVSKNETSLQNEVLKQQQYELEGKIKILRDTIEILKKELQEEKMKKEKALNEKSEEIQLKEKSFQKEIEKIQSSLQFKDQEIKAVYAKVKQLESQLKDNKVKESVLHHKSPNKFLEKFNFKKEAASHSLGVLQDQPLTSNHSSMIWKRHKLPMENPIGKTQGLHIVSSMLCNTLSSSITVQNFFTPIEMKNPNQNEHLSAFSIAQIALNEETEEIFHHSYYVLTKHLTHIQNFSNKTSSNPSSPMSSRRKELLYDKASALSCLKDLCQIVSCSQFVSVVKKLHTQENVTDDNTYKKIPIQSMSSESGTAPNLSCDKEFEEKVRKLLQLLFVLLNPKTYPDGYYLNEEMDLSLSILVSWSFVDCKSILNVFDEQLINSHIKNCYSIPSTCIVLKLLINLCAHQEYISRSMHKDDSCHICAVATLLHQKIAKSPLESIDLMLLVENYISSLFTNHSFYNLKLEMSTCLKLLLQGFMSSLFEFCKIRKQSSKSSLFLKKGFTLLHFLSKYIPDFKERRSDSDDLYISLVTELLMLSKDESTFKEFYEITREMWDFQEEPSEFYLDDSPDEAMQTEDSTSQE